MKARNTGSDVRIVCVQQLYQLDPILRIVPHKHVILEMMAENTVF